MTFAVDITNEYIANKKDIVFYAGKDIVNREHTFYDVDEVIWTFTDAIGFTFKIWEEREGGLLMISWDNTANLTQSANGFFLTASGSETDIEKGRYYYEIEYLVAGGYSVLIAYGEAKFI